MGGFATLSLLITGTNIEENEFNTFLSAALLSSNDWMKSPVITSTPFLPNMEIQKIRLLRITSYIIDKNEVLSLSRYCSSREELTPSIVFTATGKSDVQDGGLQLNLAVRDTTQDWKTSSYTASDMVVGSGRALYLTTVCQHLVCKVQFDITIRWIVSWLVPAKAATNNILLSISSPTIEREVNGITTSTIITTCSNTSFPSYIDYDVTLRPLEQDDASRVVEETLIIVSLAMYYKPTNDTTFISSINLELMELPTQMKKNADMMRIKATPLPLVTTTKRVTSTIGSELPKQHSATSTDRLPVLQDLVLLAAEIKALDRQDKLEEYSSGNSRPKPPPWPNKALFGAYKPQFDAASTHTDTNSFSVTPTISPLASPSTSPTTSTPSESFNAIIPTVNKHCMTTTRTTRTLTCSAAPRHGRVSSEKSHKTSTPSEVPILPPPAVGPPLVRPTSHLASPCSLTRVSITRQSHPDVILSIGLKVSLLYRALLQVSPYFFQSRRIIWPKGRQICGFACKK